MTTPTPTPRTDAQEYYIDGHYHVSVELARRLERELAEAQRERDAWRGCAARLDVELYNLALLADHLMRGESQYDVEAELEGANKALAAYTKLKEASK